MAAPLLFDTDILVEYMRGRPAAVSEVFLTAFDTVAVDGETAVNFDAPLPAKLRRFFRS